MKWNYSSKMLGPTEQGRLTPNNPFHSRPGLKRGFLEGFLLINFVAFSTVFGISRPAGEGHVPGADFVQ
jgi:hypothetical protein